MPDATQVQFNFINASIFFQSHTATFAEPSASQNYASSVFGLGPDVARVQINQLTVLTILITELERGYKALQPIPVRIEKSGDAYVASFEEANIHASGETWASAALALKSLILDIYDSLIGETAALGPGPKRQLATLLRYVKTQ